MNASASARRRRNALALLAVAVGAVVLGVAVLGGAPRATPTPGGSPTASPRAIADRPPMAVDGHVREADLLHDSRNDLYRTPVGAVPAGAAVTLRIRAAAGDLATAEVRVVDRLTSRAAVLPMEKVATDPTGGEHGYDYWQATIRMSATPTVLDYTFAVHDGRAIRYLSDDPALDGGTGGNYRDPPKDGGWQITAYDPAFTTPAWAHGAVVYQIFPDRFFNGDPSNDPSPKAKRGASGADRYRYGDVYGNPVLVKAWDQRPEGYCRAYQGVSCGEAPLGRDFFGGDLAGITAKLDELSNVGVTALYLNPIFAAPSNHRYDTSDYSIVDPDLGSNADFATLVATARGHGIRVILDGVFNHVSSDSPWFDRAHRFAEVGACESAASPYRGWFTFRAPGPNEPSPCAPTQPGGSDTYYNGWFGFDTIPEVSEVPAFLDLIAGPDGIVPRWLDAGAAGWRLDVLDSLSPDFIRRIRVAARAADPNALVIGEQWGDSSTWLLGDQVDSTMNYRFRRAVIPFVNGDTVDTKGALEALSPSGFEMAMLAVQEDYPRPAFDALLNLVDSHDTARVLWTLTPGAENDQAKSDPAAVAEGKAKLRLVAAIQLTWPGMASIYYGDEVGLSGHDDPDDRRPYPWGSEDEALRAFYRTLATLRAQHVALREGDLRFLLADDDMNTLAFMRRTEADAAITVVNVSTEPRTVVLDVEGALPDGTRLDDALGGGSAVVAGGRLTVQLAARTAAVLLAPAGTDLAPPPAPRGLAAAATTGRVDLSWAPVEGAAGYRVWRSLVSGGGYVPLADVSGAVYADAAVRNGTHYDYVVTAFDTAGNVSGRSNEVVALPQLHLADVRLDGPATVETPLSATGDGALVVAGVSVPGATEAAGQALGVRVEVGLGTVGSDPAADAGWTWLEAAFSGDADGSDQYTATLRPESSGAFDVAARASTDAGETWTYGDLGGSADGYQAAQAVRITAVPGTDRVAPPAPGAPEVADVGSDHVTLQWAPVDAADLYGYTVLRSGGAASAPEPVGSTADPTFNDTSVGTDTTYTYVIVAVDTSFNRSEPSAPLEVKAAERTVQVTFTVHVPANTPPGDTLYIAGDFQGWNPGGTPMTRAAGGDWTITLPFSDGTSLQYKFTRGSWDAVEKDGGCGEIPNRTLTVSYGSSGSQLVDHTVGKWRDIDHCG